MAKAPDGSDAAPRVMIYSQDGLGLGHLRRTTLLAAECLAAAPTASVLTVCDSPLSQFFARRDGHDYVKLPSIRKIRPGEWSPISLAQRFGDVLRLRTELIRTAANGFRPDVLLVDHMPHGAMGELVPTLHALRRMGTRAVLGLRDILDAPETVRERWHLEGAFDAVEEHFDQVLVYGSRNVFDVAHEYAWPAAVRDRLRYCGYVSSPAPDTPGEELRRRYLGAHEHDGQLVVAMAGGGADAVELFDTLVTAAPEVLAGRRGAVVVITGPFFPAEERTRLTALAGPGVTVLTSVPDALSYMRAADLVVAMAGYNTTVELLTTGARALLVPRRGPSAEQQMRASRFAARGWVRWLPPEQLDPASLADAVAAALEAPVSPVRLAPDLDGRRRAARHLLAATPSTRTAVRPAIPAQTIGLAALGGPTL